MEGIGLELLFLLLPLAALSGWWIGRRKKRRAKGSNDCPSLSHDFLKGLNYLLNEQNDEALEVFIRMSETDSETVDIQFALASLFLRRGEVDRAIRIHQNLIARPMLPPEQRKQALYELGRDYMRAGLLDRAESLFQELTGDARYGEPSRRQLLDIFQQEKEWEKAIAVARRLSPQNGESLAPVIANYYCELAEEYLAAGESGEATKANKRAFAEDKNCVRASLFEAELALRHNQSKQALKAYQRVERQDADYLPLIIEPLQRCYEQLGDEHGLMRQLRELLGRHETISLVQAMVQQLCDRGDEAEAVQLLKEHLQRRPSLRALQQLLALRCSEQMHTDNSDITIIRDIVEKLLVAKPIFRCSHCGFASKTMHWQCPSCKQWNRVKPIHGIEGE
jgi:lipopolysaccharide biosynthesis regulator YciM